MSEATEPEIICERRGAIGHVTLNRPKALNALTLAMVQDLHAALDAWAGDEAVRCVVITGAGERAFCAGGDIRQAHALGTTGRAAEARTFFLAEYALNALIARYPKPYVALLDGIVMGGGVGVSVHGSHRVAGARTALAMPETGIGFFPDVGATYALPRLPGRSGTYLALTGERIAQGDVLALGLATHAADAADFAAIVGALAEGEAVDAVLARHAPRTLPEPGPVSKARAEIDACFGADDVPGVLARLDAAADGGSAFCAQAAATMRTRSPTSLAIAHAQMQRGGALTFPEAMLTEYRIVCRVLDGHDFYEGVRAVLIDRDNRPAWSPATLDAVTPAAVARYFEPLPAPEPSFA